MKSLSVFNLALVININFNMELFECLLKAYGQGFFEMRIDDCTQDEI